MKTNVDVNVTMATGQQVRKPWEAPCIVLERSLEVSAQDRGPSNLQVPPAPGGFLGPLNDSNGVC